MTTKPDAVSELLFAAEELRRVARTLETVDLPQPARGDLAALIGEIRYRAYGCVSLAAERLAPAETAPVSRRRAGSG